MITVTSAQLTTMFDRSEKGRELLVLLAVIWTVTLYFMGSPLDPAIPTIMSIIVAALTVVVYFTTLRITNRRSNNYSPTMNDQELERTRLKWGHDGKWILYMVLFFINIQVTRLFDSWWWALIPAAIGAAIMWFWLSANPNTDLTISSEVKYIPVRRLFGGAPEAPAFVNRQFYGADAIVAIMHAQKLIPGGYQRTDTTLINELSDMGWNREQVTSAIKDGIADGRIIQIREMRSRENTDHWLTLTEKSTWDYQQAAQVDHTRPAE